MSKQRDTFKNSVGDQFIMILKFQAVIKMADIVFSVRLNPLSPACYVCNSQLSRQRSREGQCASDLSVSSNTSAE